MDAGFSSLPGMPPLTENVYFLAYCWGAVSFWLSTGTFYYLQMVSPAHKEAWKPRGNHDQESWMRAFRKAAWNLHVSLPLFVAFCAVISFKAFEAYGVDTKAIRWVEPSALRMLISFSVMALVDDAVFWSAHRGLHAHPYLFKKIHSLHHRYHNPIAPAVFYTHPIDFIASYVSPPPPPSARLAAPAHARVPLPPNIRRRLPPPISWPLPAASPPQGAAHPHRLRRHPPPSLPPPPGPRADGLAGPQATEFWVGPLLVYVGVLDVFTVCLYNFVGVAGAVLIHGGVKCRIPLLGLDLAKFHSFHHKMGDSHYGVWGIVDALVVSSPPPTPAEHRLSPYLRRRSLLIADEAAARHPLMECCTCFAQGTGVDFSRTHKANGVKVNDYEGEERAKSF